MYYGFVSVTEIEEKYAGLYAVSRLTVSTPAVLRRFAALNEGKGWKEQIKPFNFFLLGFQVTEVDGTSVKPLSPYTRDSQRIVHEPFIDYESSRVMRGVEYFKPLSKTIAAYCDHPEHKYDGNTGYLSGNG